jgi:ABC-type spermidine/putrescine transport system permease subunit I
MIFETAIVLAALSGLVAAVFWVRVASNRSLSEASRLDGTEKLAERSNRRAYRAAVIASALCAALVVLACLAGRAAGVS